MMACDLINSVFDWKDALHSTLHIVNVVVDNALTCPYI